MVFQSIERFDPVKIVDEDDAVHVLQVGGRRRGGRRVFSLEKGG